MADSVEFEASDLEDAHDGMGRAYEAVGPSKREFLPWHRPRKHFVRSEQWARVIESHLHNAPVINRPLKYFGLPGDDLLDIRYFVNRICKAKGLKLQFLGFNLGVDRDANRKMVADGALDQVRKSGAVAELSDVLFDAFSDLAQDRSVSRRQMNAHGHFDIVNLDFCNGLATRKPLGSSESDYNAIQWLLGAQFRSSIPWLFFLTTRIGEHHCNRDTLSMFSALVCQNCDQCDGFQTLVDAICEGSYLDASDEIRLLVDNLCGLLKWLGGMCVQHGGWKLEVWRVDGYSVLPESPMSDLFSIAIRFVPIQTAVQDPTGLGTSQVSRDDECRIALQAAKKISSRTDVDTLLSSDAPLYQKIVREKIELLSEAGFEADDYKIQLSNWGLPAFSTIP